MTIPRNATGAMDELFNASAVLQMGRYGICEFPSSLGDITERDLSRVMNLVRLLEIADQLILDVVEYIDEIRDLIPPSAS